MLIVQKELVQGTVMLEPKSGVEGQNRGLVEARKAQVGNGKRHL